MAILAALMALVLLPSATKAGSVARAAPEAAKPPALKCAVASIKLVATSMVATGGCRIGTKPAPAKWAWVQKAADLSDSPCRFGSGKGTGKRSNLLAYPAGVPRISGPAIPGLVNATFTVTARWGKQRAKATRSFQKRTPNSRVLCGAPPKLVSLDGPESSALTWATPPSFDGAVLRPGTLQSRGNGLCRWNQPRFLTTRMGYLLHGSEFSCANGANGYVSASIFYTPAGEVKCRGVLQPVSSFPVPSYWGPGSIYLRLTIATWDAGDRQYPYVSNKDNPGSYNQWNPADWTKVYGSVDPCTTDLR